MSLVYLQSLLQLGRTITIFRQIIQNLSKSVMNLLGVISIVEVSNWSADSCD